MIMWYSCDSNNFGDMLDVMLHFFTLYHIQNVCSYVKDDYSRV